MKNLITIILSIGCLLFALPSVAHAQNANEIKSRMAERLSKLVQLQQAELIGENNQGYLTVRGNVSASEKALIDAENVDRKAAYQIIATKTQTSVEKVGQLRAASIREKASKGTWIQLPNGTWKQA
jgi:uncharacterized protein YdbL (DUF1318 family)